MKCSIHSKTVEYFCKGHEKNICSDCAVFDHRSCEVTALAATKKHEKLLGSVSEFLLEASQMEKKNLESISALTESKNTMERKIIEHFAQMKERIDTAEKDQINMLQCKYDCELGGLKENQEKCQNLSENLQAAMEELRQRKGDSSTDIENCEENILDLKRQLEKTLKSIRGKGAIHISLRSDIDLENRMEKLSTLVGEVMVNISTEDNQPIGASGGKGPQQLLGFGNRFLDQNGTMENSGLPPSYAIAVQQFGGPMLNINPPPGAPGVVHMAHPSSVPSAATPQILPLGPFGPTSNAPKSLIQVASFNAKRPSDKTHCWLTGAAFLSNDNIVMADRNNKKVKLFSNTFYCIAEMAMQTYPFDVAETCTGEIAVSLPKQNRVGFFHLETLTPCSHYIDTEQPCLGITSGHERLYVCCDTTWSKVGCIRVYDKFNQLLIKIEKDDRGKDMVSVTDYLTVCPLSGNLFFKRGGLSKECIHCTTNQGTILWKAKVPSWMDVPAGLAVLNDGLIVSIGSLKWISPGGQKWEKLIDSSDVGGPCALSVSHDKTRLLVTQADAISNCKENDEVRIFNILYQIG